MFKRLAKFNHKRAQDEARGIDVSQDAPPESLLDETDSSSDEAEEDDSDSDLDDGDDSGEEDAGARVTSTPAKRKRRNGNGDESDEEESSADSDEGDSEADEDEDEDEDEDDPSLPPMSISQSLQSPFFISPDSPLKAGQPWITCLVCPLSQLKSDKQVEVHDQAKSHQRRYKRYRAFVEGKLTETERVNEFDKGGADPRAIAAELEANVSRSAEKAPGAKGPKRQFVRPEQTKPVAGGSEDSVAGVPSSTSTERSRARKERKEANKRAWKQAKEARRLARKQAESSAPTTSDTAQDSDPPAAAAAAVDGVSAKSANGVDGGSSHKRPKKEKKKARVASSTKSRK
ncbi:unnamed protein product [Parajaminaea phylloscopi]